MLSFLVSQTLFTFIYLWQKLKSWMMIRSAFMDACHKQEPTATGSILLQKQWRRLALVHTETGADDSGRTGRALTLCIKANKGCSGEDTFLGVRRYVLLRTGLRPRWYGCPCKQYPPQLSKVSLSADRRLRVSCQTFVCQLSKVSVKIFLGA